MAPTRRGRPEAGDAGGYDDLSPNIIYKDVDGTLCMVNYSSPSSNQSSSSTSSSTQGQATSSHEATEDTASQEDGGKNWTPAKVRHLIVLYASHKDSFINSARKKKDTWQKIADNLNSTGTQTTFSAGDVDKKWRGLKERYRKIKDGNKQTGNSRTSWQYYDELATVLETDPGVTPPVVLTAGGSHSIQLDEEPPTTSASTSSATVSPPLVSPPLRRRRASDEPPEWAIQIMKKQKKESKKMRKEIKALVAEERRRNDLQSRYLFGQHAPTEQDD